MHKRRFGLTAFGIVSLTLFGAVGVLRAASPGQADAQVSIAGRVSDLQGIAIEGAKVTLIQMIYAESASVPNPRVVDERSTAGDGTFVLIIPAGVDPKRMSFVVARKDGLSLGWASWRMQSNQPVDIMLGEAKDLMGEVVDEQGQPVAEAEVRIGAAMMGKGATRRSLAVPGFLLVRTDAGGRFHFADMPAEATFEFSVAKPGRAEVFTLDRRASIQNGYQFAPGQAGIRVVSPLEAVVAGSVVDKAGGKPVRGVSVIALSTSPQGTRVSPRPVMSSEDGTFRIDGLAAGAYAVQTTVPRDRLAEWAAEPVQVVLKAGETKSDVRLELVKGSVIEALVRDAAGKPVAKATVSVRNVEGDQSFSGVTDENGLTRIRVRTGRYQSSGAFKEGYTRQMVRELIAIEDGETKQVEYVLNPLPKFAGIVRDEAGNPLAGVRLWAIPMGGSQATSDASGRFEVTGEFAPFGEDDTKFVLVARDLSRNLACAVDVDEQTGPLDIRLKSGVTIAGTVLDHEGKPLQGADVRVMLHGPRWRAVVGVGEPIVSDKDGVFEVQAIPVDRQYTVTAIVGGYGNQDRPINTSDLKDSRIEAGQFKLVQASLSITGVVVDPNDKPVAGAEIRCYADLQGDGNGQPDRLNMQTIQTDAEGRFTVTGVCPGPIRLSVSTRGRAPLYGMTQVDGGAADVKIVLSERRTGLRYVPRKPASLKGKSLPPLSDLGIDLPADAAGKMLLVCFWDMGQRPSRYCVMQLAARASQLGEKGVIVAVVQAAEAEGNALNQWIKENKIPFQAGRIRGDMEKAKFAWGVASLPHMILTNKEHIVVAEGFALADLDGQIEAAGR